MVLRDTLKECFGHETFRPGQAEVIGKLLEGRSVLALFPTGSGKSLCYQLPAMLLEGLTIVVSPLIALMKDQVDTLRAHRIPAGRLDSTLEADEAGAILAALGSGRLKLLYLSPERLANEAFLRRLEGIKVALFAIDEAHCLSEWGHNFRPDYLRLPDVARRLAAERVLALTATATPSVARQVRERFGIAAEDHVQTGFSRPNLRFRVHPCAGAERERKLTALFEEADSCPAIVYTTLQETTEKIAALLRRSGIAARAYHAGMRDTDRAEVQDRFMSGDVPVVVATVAFGMGVDKADIRRVIHFNLPKSPENYLQESGRAGRDGLPSTCDLLACADDITTLENFVYGDTPTPSALKSLVEHVLLRGEYFSVSRQELSRSRDIRAPVVETALTYLELDGVIHAEGSRHAGSEVRLLRSLREVLAGLPEEEKRLVSGLLSTARSGRLWHRIDHAAAAADLGISDGEVRRLLGDLASHGGAVVRPWGLRGNYRLVPSSGRSVATVAARLIERFESREEAEIARLHRVVSIAESPGCLSRQLLEYFGEEVPACGNCGNCLGHGSPGALPSAGSPVLTLEDAEMIQGLKSERHPALRHPRQMARFLCGLTSPATAQAGLTKDDRFGSLAGLPFLEVLAQVSS